MVFRSPNYSLTAPPGSASEPPARLVLDLERLGQVPADKVGPLARYAAAIQAQRGDYNGRILSIRQDDLRTLAVIYDEPPGVLADQLVAWGVLNAEARQKRLISALSPAIPVPKVPTVTPLLLLSDRSQQPCSTRRSLIDPQTLFSNLGSFRRVRLNQNPPGGRASRWWCRARPAEPAIPTTTLSPGAANDICEIRRSTSSTSSSVWCTFLPSKGDPHTSAR